MEQSHTEAGDGAKSGDGTATGDSIYTGNGAKIGGATAGERHSNFLVLLATDLWA